MQEQKQRSDQAKSEETPVEPKHLEKNVDDEAIDALLDEIDGVLEENAQEFVDGFIQRGGE